MTNETTAHQAALKRWICQIYACRGVINDSTWEAFAKFCEENGYTDEPPPGKRLDARNRWDVFEEELC